MRRTRYTSPYRTHQRRAYGGTKRRAAVHLEYLVLGAGLVALLLSTVVWLGAQRSRRHAWRLLEWQQQQSRTIEQGGTVISVELKTRSRHRTTCTS